ncbi:MAG TPA: hypothetical protein VL088_10400 [Pedobacter sp.]|nr:hypothetical protein [Pedobacter sp.]
MKKVLFCLLVMLLACATSGFAQYVNYEVKVVLDSFKNIRGTLQKVSPEGIAIQDFRGNYYIFKAKDIVKITVRRKGLTVAEGLGTGSAIGLSAGVAIFFTNDTFDDFGEKAFGTAFLTGVGAIGGTLGGLVGEALNTKLRLKINLNAQTFEKEYLKLEKYSKAYYLEKNLNTTR